MNNPISGKVSLTVIKQSNEITHCLKNLSLDERRVFRMAIASMSKDQPLSPTEPVVIEAQPFYEMFYDKDKKVGSLYSKLESGSKQLYNRTICLKDKENKHTINKRVLRRYDYNENEGSVSLYFDNDMIPYISNLKEKYTQFFLEGIAQLKNKYADGFYELLSQWRGKSMAAGQKRKVHLTLVQIREIFGLQESYKEWKRLKEKVIDPSVNGINEHTDMIVSYKTVKKGRFVNSLLFEWEQKASQVDIEEAQIALEGFFEDIDQAKIKKSEDPPSFTTQ